MRRLAQLVCVLLASVVLSGCGEREERLTPANPSHLDVAVGRANAGQAGVYAAQTRGHFREAGLEVRIHHAENPLEELSSGRADIALVPEPDLLEARNRGQSIVSAAAFVNRPLQSLVWLRSSGIRDPAGLRDRRVGTPGAEYHIAFLKTIVEKSGAVAAKPVTIEGSLAKALLDRKVDAALGAYLNEDALDPRIARRDPTVIPVDRAGVPRYAEVMAVVREDDLDSRAGEIRGFVGAVGRGTQDLSRTRAVTEAVAALVGADRTIRGAVHRAGIARTLPLLAVPRGRPYGSPAPRARRAFATYLRRSGVIAEPSGDAFTNELLPGQGLP